MSNNSGNATAVKPAHFPRRSIIGEGKGPKRSFVFWFSTWWPVVVAIGVIVLESTPWGGADHTSGPLRAVYEFFFGPIANDRWEIIHHYTRKTGHFVGYGLLCLTWLRALRLSFPRFSFMKYAEFAVLCTGIVAAADEFHQHFLPNRGSSPWDVLLDCCGAAFMCFAVWTLLYAIRHQPPGQPR
jgi:VanZ family protein